MTTDVDRSAVSLAFREAILDCQTARIRHARGPHCTHDLRCPVCSGLVWAEDVFRHWWRLDIGADDLQAAIFFLRGAQ
jgi:hypothetical protein